MDQINGQIRIAEERQLVLANKEVPTVNKIPRARRKVQQTILKALKKYTARYKFKMR